MAIETAAVGIFLSSIRHFSPLLVSARNSAIALRP
jgi:hypothetical protein